MNLPYYSWSVNQCTGQIHVKFFYFFKVWEMLAHICNPCYSEGRDQDDAVQSSPGK
jgi:hypothetical protein